MKIYKVWFGFYHGIYPYEIKKETKNFYFTKTNERLHKKCKSYECFKNADEAEERYKKWKHQKY